LYVCSNEPEQPAVALSAELTVTLNWLTGLCM
jgi:hypothetical protein